MRIGIIMGGFSAERHISVESGRNVYEKLASSGTYTPIPIFLTGSPSQHSLFILPIHILLKDSADDIHEKLKHITTNTNDSTNWAKEPAIDAIIQKYVGSFTVEPTAITYQQLANLVDSAFIALHGRPGEDGTLQAILEQHGLPYNGSGVVTTSLTIDKFATNRFLHKHDINVANQTVVKIDEWKNNPLATIKDIEAIFTYPFIVKPVDDGCSVAVLKIQNRDMFIAYAENIFRTGSDQPNNITQVLGLKPNAAFPNYQQFLVEDLLEKGTAIHFLEITGGLLTHLDVQGNKQYEMFEPSEVVAAGDILSLEEKFLAGEGQNLTPARFHPDSVTNAAISAKVKKDLQKVAELVNIEGYARIDAMVKIYAEYIETWIIEINTLPALTPATCIFHQCAINGYRPFDFIHTIIQYGYKKARIATI
jgi:D-alanine-D-alanine ligase